MFWYSFGCTFKDALFDPFKRTLMRRLSILPTALSSLVVAGMITVVSLGLAPSVVAQGVPCSAGKVTSMSSGAQHDCNNVSLLAHVTPGNMGQATGLNDIWGWSDDESDLEVVLSGWSDGVSVIDVTNPGNPMYIALIPKTPGTNRSTWRDIKVYGHYAFITAEPGSGSGSTPIPHGIQIVDLSVLRGHTGPRVVLTPVTTYTEVNFAHNIVINEEAGFAYAVGSSGGESCGGGLHAIDIRNPEVPAFAGCISDVRTARGYTHDAQCVVYRGPDLDHSGKEVCFAANENAVSIVDVTDKANPEYLGIASYATSQYVHQAWLSEDPRFLFQNDELDEFRLPNLITHTRTMIWDVADLEDPVLVKEFFAANTSIDHNLYVKGNFMYQSNYIDGLRVLDVSDPSSITETAFFDSHPISFTSVWDGSWSNYPFLRSGAVAINSDAGNQASNSDKGGVYIVCINGQTCTSQSVDTDEEAEVPSRVQLEPAYPNPFNPQTTIRYSVPQTMTVRIAVSDALGREVALLVDGNQVQAGSHSLLFDASALPSGTYLVRLETELGTETRQIVLLK